MAVILNASTSSGFVQSADTSGVVQIQSNGSTVLTVASTGVTATNIQGTIVQGTAVATTSGTAFDFTGIPSWAKRITVMFSGVSLSGTEAICIQLGDSGGIETTGYLSAASDNGTFVGTSTTSLLCMPGGGAISASSLTNGTCVISNFNGNTWVSSAVTAGTTGVYAANATGSKTLSDVLTQIRVTRTGTTNTFDAGTINIQYEG